MSKVEYRHFRNRGDCPCGCGTTIQLRTGGMTIGFTRHLDEDEWASGVTYTMAFCSDKDFYSRPKGRELVDSRITDGEFISLELIKDYLSANTGKYFKGITRNCALEMIEGLEITDISSEIIINLILDIEAEFNDTIQMELEANEG